MGGQRRDERRDARERRRKKRPTRKEFASIRANVRRARTAGGSILSTVEKERAGDCCVRPFAGCGRAGWGGPRARRVEGNTAASEEFDTRRERTGMCSFLFQSQPTTWWPSSLRRFARCDAMKPPAPVTQILSFFSGQYGSVP